MRRFGDFGGRSDWKEYASFLGINLGVTLCLHGLEQWSGDGFFGTVALFYSILVLLPGLAITVRFVRYLKGRGSTV
ncbi:uncharacterized membrane protein YhaH (DUF805 family) [Lewinella aquimaris]|uniref:Uncharacterized membrane protein YhaH (DUF805 family) n=1 Tax=Neolewinella aquimaris TaxID=1835722 RepID=A0A840E887_9BACT|nr:hypothetical protein [Neolewinella aquimaris]MBB4079932.1 uncharacterized membrane protein YhaH (DUF805 family) [Neolewinella aquimaris]